MKKLHTYTRILLSLLLMLVTNVVMGQGQVGEANIPIKEIESPWEQRPNNDFPETNLKDGKETTKWKSGRDLFAVLEYMRVKDPDKNDDGKRSWVEIPYIPNNNTEIEISFQAKTDGLSTNRNQYIYGCGLPLINNTGLSFGLNKDGYIVRSSNKEYNINVTPDNNTHTLIYSRTSIKFDGTEYYNGDGSDYIVEEQKTTGQHELCFFASPQDDQQWARNFEGKIFSIKIRENNKLLYDLIPVTGWWGRPGFYDRISTNVYTFFDMVDYVSNTDVTDGAPLHIHYKIPYKMGTGTTARTLWTDNLVTNGNFASDDTASYTFVKDIFVPRISSDQYGKYIQVYNNGTHPTGNVWDCHLTIKLTEELAAGQKYDLSFYAKASKNVVATFDFSNAAGDWHSGDNVIKSATKNIQFATGGWVLHQYTIEGRNDDSKGLIKGIGLNFNNEKSAVLYNVAAFELKKQGETASLVADHNNYTNLTDYPINDAINDNSWTTRVTTNQEKKCVQVVNSGTGANAWDCQFRMNLGQTLKEGDQYSISFNIKAKNAANISGQLQQTGGGYYSVLPQAQVGTTWKRVEWTGTVGAHEGVVGAIGLLLNETKAANTYYITDIVIKKGTSSTDQVPNTELEITYKNTRTTQDYSSTRYLFSYGPKEDNVLALGVTMDGYKYTTGGITTDFGTVPNVKNEKITTVFRPTEFVRGSVYNVTGATTWNTAVNNFYLFGTHSTSDPYARSFIGEIYGAVIREGGNVKVNLQPAWKNGEYGFYDKVSKTFCTKDTVDNSLCGQGAYFRGVTNHDRQAPINHADGIPKVQDEYVSPYELIIDLDNPKVVKNFYMTTITRDIPVGPKKIFLYGSTDDGQNWEPIIYDQEVDWESVDTELHFSSMATDGTVQYLYNVETGTFMTGGNDYGTRTTASTEKGNPVRIVKATNGKYRITDKPGNQWDDPVKALDCDGNKASWVDGQGRSGDGDWNITSIGNNLYNITNDKAGNLKWGVQRSMKNTRIVFNDSTEVYGTTWAFVNEADYNDYMRAHTIRYPINANNTPYGRFRFVIESIDGGDALTLADLAFTSNFDFEHSVGRVYDGTMGTPPDNLAVNGSSGYKQAYKVQGNAPDDPRLNEGVTIQRTHEYEHVLYTLPGQTINLTPFSDFDYPNVTNDKEYSSAYNYRERYIRWYDYPSDKRSTVLAFDPRNGHKVSALEKGHFAWNNTGFNNYRTREGSVAKYTAPEESDDDGVFGVIALEAANVFNWDNAEWDATKQAYLVKEPTLQWRHTFVIKNARVRADEMFDTQEKNSTYITNNKIKLMCPANVPFQYPLPSYEYATAGAHHPTDFYYADNNGVYTPVYHYSIKTERWDGSSYVNLGTKTIKTTYIPGELTTPSEAEINAVPDARIVTLTEEEKKDKTQEQINALIAKKIDALTDEQKSTLRTEAAKADKTTAVTKQLAMSYKTLQGYNRVFYMQEPQEGKYQITIYALSEDAATPLRLERFGPNAPLPIMQYELEVLPPDDGVMITETELNSKSAYKHQRPKEMDRLYIRPTTEVNFDNVKEKTDTLDVHSYLKWPWRWEDSSYGFGYTDRGDYNMYVIADHMTVTPFYGRGNDDVTDKETFKNVYDRLYNETNGKKKGYFFYANAASDPSRMSVLNIGKNFCPNTKVYVSAWINEFQGANVNAETANVIFSFRGVDEKGNEKVLNSFVTGYVPGGWNTPYGYDKEGFVDAHTAASEGEAPKNPDCRGKWMHVYYTFIPEVSAADANTFDHYIITLENNCTSSVGADYAIDDIRCYVTGADLKARQKRPVCNGSYVADLDMFADYNLMKTFYNFTELTGDDSELMQFDYCFLDSAKYVNSLKADYETWYNNAGAELKEEYPTFEDWRYKSKSDAVLTAFMAAKTNAFSAARITGSYTNNKNYGTVSMDKNFSKNSHTEVVGTSTRIVYFEGATTDQNMQLGTRYIVVMVPHTDTPVFDVEDPCQSVNYFEIIAYHPIVKVDGHPTADLQGLSFCANQKPIVNVDLTGIKQGGEKYEPENLLFDWYFGPKSPVDGYMDYDHDKSSDTELHTAVYQLRKKYSSKTQKDVMELTDTDCDESFTPAMLALIKQRVEEKKLVLGKAFEVLSTTDLYGETEHRDKFYITVIPFEPPSPEDDDEEILYCLDAFQVSVNLDQNAPSMKDGDDKGIINYPSDITDVPLRIGLKQLRRTVIDKLSHTFTESDKLLWLPLREVNGSINDVTLLKKHETNRTDFDVEPAEIHTATDDLIYLAASNDPAVLAGTSGAVDITTSSSSDPMWPIISDLKVVGKVHSINAQKGTNKGSVAKLAFLKGFKFREGYWYTLKFHYEDDYTGVTGDHPAACPGDLVFTIKVVPEYQMWTGAVSRNWNDDRNWRRVTKEDLLWDDSRKTANVDYITDGGTNDNVESFAPADFTKVIIPAGVKHVPYMYDLREATNKTSVHFTGAPVAGDQIKTTRPAADIYDQILEAESYEQEYLDLNGKMFVITDLSGQNTLEVSHTENSRPDGVGEQNAFVVSNSHYTDDMHVYAKFARVVKTGVEGNVYTIQLCKENGENYAMWGTNGYLNFQPAGQNIVFALGLGAGQKYGQDAVNCALWKVTSVGDGEVTLQNVGNGGYLNPSVAAPSADPVVCQLAQNFGTTGASGIYHQTSLVQYDMASINRPDNDVACRPWYDHTCDQIHFNSGAAMMDQRYLYYNKAWCDIEVPVGTWQTVASPLMNIVAGDLYLPTASARQDTPLFEDIFYDAGDSEHPGLNDRFAPAVFQRSWNKSMAKVYELGGDQPRNVGIKLDWSHVYNDVNVRYGAGQGFSIKVDVSSDLVTNKPATAKFRFPKADTQYTYYNPGNDDGTNAGYDRRDEDVNGSDIVGDVRPGRLADLTTATFQEVVGDNSNAATATSYFLVGNPLMCWLNMQKFFAENSQFEPKYWTVTANGQQTALFTEENWVSTSQENPQFLPPGVSFFVKKGVDATTGATTTVTPVFDNTMMSYTQAEPRQNGNDYDRPTNDPTGGDSDNNKDGSRNNAKTRSANSTMPQLHMTATDVNGRQSRALLMDGTMMEHEGVETLFDSNLKDDALLYTTKEGMAKTIASIAPGDTLPLAVSGARDEVQLSIEGVKDFDFDLFLIDSEEGTVEPLEGDIVLKQAASGVRYYIATRSKDDTEVEGDVNVPRVTAKDGYITVYAPVACEIETSAIYNTGGIRLDFAEHIAESHSVKLLPGIYIVHLLCDGKTYTYKLMLR